MGYDVDEDSTIYSVILRRIVNGLIFFGFTPLYIFQKMIDYRDADVWDEEPLDEEDANE